NDSDADGDPLTASVVSGPSHGMASLAGDGSFTYTPDYGFYGIDTFTYHDFDGTSYSNTATVTINVTQIVLDTDGNAFAALRAKSSTIDVGSFTPEPNTSYTQYVATINWGDGQISAGTIDSSFHVSGTHTYNLAASYAVAFQVVNVQDAATGVG